MSKRRYTGNKDAVHPAKREGTQVMQDYLVYLFGLRKLGIYSNRDVRGSSKANPPKSVHATWRACDLGGTPAQLKSAIRFLYKHRDILGVEEIHDYSSAYKKNPKGWGAGYRCDRDAWRIYDRNTIGSKGGQWVHYEIAPAMADDPERVRKAFATIFG